MLLSSLPSIPALLPKRDQSQPPLMALKFRKPVVFLSALPVTFKKVVRIVNKVAFPLPLRFQEYLVRVASGIL
jgi:hypothetical protein